MELRYSEERSSKDRALYYISGGVLMNPSVNERGRMEFRKIPGTNEVIIAIHDYLPSLPWFIYYVTQANMHAFVMWSFQRHMKSLSISDEKSVEISTFTYEKYLSI